MSVGRFLGQREIRGGQEVQPGEREHEPEEQRQAEQAECRGDGVGGQPEVVPAVADGPGRCSSGCRSSRRQNTLKDSAMKVLMPP